MGSNTILIVDEDFRKVDVRHVGDIVETHGFSSFKVRVRGGKGGAAQSVLYLLLFSATLVWFLATSHALTLASGWRPSGPFVPTHRDCGNMWAAQRPKAAVGMTLA